MSDILEWLMQMIQQAGQHPLTAYLLMYVVLVTTGAGIPISEELVTMLAGVLAYNGVIDVMPAWICCYLGIMTADSIIVYIGWHFGKAVLHRRWVKRLLHPRRVLWARHQILEHGAWMIVFSRFIPGTRYATLLIVGMMHIPRWKFLLADGTTAMVTTSVQMAVGFYLAHLFSDWQQVLEYRWAIATITAAVGVAMIIGYVIIRRRRTRQSGEQRDNSHRMAA